MRRIILWVALLLVGVAASAQEGSTPSAPSSRQARREQRAAEFRAEIAKMVESRNFRFLPITMQNITSGNTRYIFAWYLYFDVQGSEAMVHMPVEFTSYVIDTENFDSTIYGYQAVNEAGNWRVGFSIIHEGERWLVELFVSEVTGQARLALVTSRGVMRYIGSLTTSRTTKQTTHTWGLF